ncbi:MAG: CBS domain-containing protein [Desulfonauticus sp.]|nr:CBS domain-containing protein [Desulfonauticus sp.]
MKKKNKIKADTIITCHLNADFDALAAMIAAKKLYPNAVLIFPGSQEKNLRNFIIESASYLYNFKTIEDILPEMIKLLVIVDTRQRKRLKHIEKILSNHQVQIHIYDHHPPSSDDIKGDYIYYKPWGATTTILTLLLKEKNIPLTDAEATLLGLGIYEDTGLFTFHSTTYYDFMAAGYLKKYNMDLNIISEFTKRDLDAKQIYILNSLLKNSSTHNINGIRIVIAEISLDEYIKDFALLVHKLMEIENIKVLFCLARMSDRVHIIARSKLKEIDVGYVCNYFGGGGHKFAASASIKNKTLPQVKEELVAILYTKINPTIYVKKLMSSPPIYLESNKTLEHAASLMTRLNLKSIPVVDPDTKYCVGIIDHQVANKAVTHNLGQLFIKDYMQTNIVCVSPLSSLNEVIKIILENKQRLVPVVENKNLVGVFTKTDLINFLAQESISIPEHLLKQGKEKNIKHILKEKLSPLFYDFIVLAGNLAKDLGCNVYMVGGIVRDLLLNFPALDLDLVVEGNGLEFAKHFAQKLDARLKTHKKFQTAVVITKQGLKIDIATARLEYYEYPAALPSIAVSSLKMDLYRRDFSINALAVSLNPSKFGNLIDFFGGQKDLKEKKIRVLHALSFIEDPTRILRAVRFEQRFGFEIGKQTNKLIKNALQLNMLTKVSGQRIYNELKLIFQENRVINILFKLNEYKILESIHPLLKINTKIQDTLLEVTNILNWYHLLYKDEQVRKEIIYLLTLLYDVKYQQFNEILDRISVSKKHIKLLLDLKLKIKEILSFLHRAKNDQFKGNFYMTLDNLPIEGVLFIMAKVQKNNTRKAISKYISSYRPIKISLTGHDLLKLGLSPGPKIGEILNKVKQAYLDGLVSDKKSQLDFAKQLINQP